jgi:hypothetical protein
MNNQPSKEHIERRAYELYLARGCEDGQDWADWFAAEQQLTYMPESSANTITSAQTPAGRRRKASAGRK